MQPHQRGEGEPCQKKTRTKNTSEQSNKRRRWLPWSRVWDRAGRCAATHPWVAGDGKVESMTEGVDATHTNAFIGKKLPLIWI